MNWVDSQGLYSVRVVCGLMHCRPCLSKFRFPSSNTSILSTSSGHICHKCSSLTTLKYSTSTLASLNAGILDSIGGGSCRPRCLWQATQKRPQNACRNHSNPSVFWSVLRQIHPSLSEVSLMKGRNLLATSSEFLADTTRPISTTKSSTDLGEKLTFMDVWSCTKVVSEQAEHVLDSAPEIMTYLAEMFFFRTKCW